MAAVAALALPVRALPVSPPGRVLRVGPGEALRRIADAAETARDGDLIEIQAGDYRGDTAVWRQRSLRVRAVGGRVRLLAAGASAQDKGIWVVRCDTMEVEGLDFSGARVPDRNGAGIRHERGRLRLVDCRFTDNQNGILGGNDAEAELDLQACVFSGNGDGDGYSHNLYVGRSARLRALGCRFAQARVGHLLKSRAARSEVLGCVLDDGVDGQASYELEFPEGGDVLVAGNLIAQSARSANPALLSFAAEGLRASRQQLVLVHNTLVDRLPRGGRFIDLHRLDAAGVLSAFNNLRCGSGAWPAQAVGDAAGNRAVPPSSFESAETGRFGLRAPAPAALRAVLLPEALRRQLRQALAAPSLQRTWPAGHQRLESAASQEPPVGPPTMWVGAFGPAAA